jgi:hypothetical protein
MCAIVILLLEFRGIIHVAINSAARSDGVSPQTPSVESIWAPMGFTSFTPSYELKFKAPLAMETHERPNPIDAALSQETIDQS